MHLVGLGAIPKRVPHFMESCLGTFKNHVVTFHNAETFLYRGGPHCPKQDTFNDYAVFIEALMPELPILP